jgi:RNA polymerase sigma factor (sigma-70 family)
MKIASEKHALHGEAFEQLLAWLNPDPEHAAGDYVRFHQRLTKLFAARGCRRPEECADETFNRVAQQVVAGKEIRTDNCVLYLEGVARYVLREEWAKAQNDPGELDADKLFENDRSRRTDPAEKERRQTCLDECLQRIPEDARLLILEYYSEDKRLKTDTREQMAKRLGIEKGVLRNRIFKLRNKLRSCVVACLAP